MRNFTNANALGPSKTHTDIWLTPQWIIDDLGGWETFDLDPCGFKHSEKGHITLTAKKIYTLQDNEDGLVLPWFGDVFLNFPYSEGKVWLDKMKENTGIVLCFARTETKGFQNNIKFATGMLFLNRRVKFLTWEGEEKTNGNAPSVLTAFGESNFLRLLKFRDKNGGILTRIKT